MLYCSEKNKKKIVHFEDCSFSKTILDQNQKHFKTLFSAVKEGYRLCKRCNPLEKLYKENEKEVRSFCFENVIALDYREYEINLTTQHSKWKIIPVSRTEYLFLHANERLEKYPPKSPVPGYHPQEVHYDNLLSFCQYILEHDTYRDKHPIAIKKKFSPPKKGTRRWRGQEKKKRKKEKKKAIRKVLYLIDGLG